MHTWAKEEPENQDTALRHPPWGNVAQLPHAGPRAPGRGVLPGLTWKEGERQPPACYAHFAEQICRGSRPGDSVEGG